MQYSLNLPLVSMHESSVTYFRKNEVNRTDYSYILAVYEIKIFY